MKIACRNFIACTGLLAVAAFATQSLAQVLTSETPPPSLEGASTVNFGFGPTKYPLHLGNEASDLYLIDIADYQRNFLEGSYWDTQHAVQVYPNIRRAHVIPGKIEVANVGGRYAATISAWPQQDQRWSLEINMQLITRLVRPELQRRAFPATNALIDFPIAAHSALNNYAASQHISAHLLGNGLRRTNARDTLKINVNADGLAEWRCAIESLRASANGRDLGYNALNILTGELNLYYTVVDTTHSLPPSTLAQQPLPLTYQNQSLIFQFESADDASEADTAMNHFLEILESRVLELTKPKVCPTTTFPMVDRMNNNKPARTAG